MRIGRVVGYLALSGLALAVALAGVAMARREHTPDQRVPLLDAATIHGWIDHQRAISGDYLGYSSLIGLDLARGRTFPLPGLTGTRVIGKRAGKQRQIEQEDPFPSPDGRWLLYPEYLSEEDSTKKDWVVTTLEGTRLRLVATGGGSTRFLPANGRFERDPRTFYAWLPDSSGWILGVWDPTLRLERQDRAAPDRIRPLPTPQGRVRLPDFLGVTDPPLEIRVIAPDELVLDKPLYQDETPGKAWDEKMAWLQYVSLTRRAAPRSVRLPMPTGVQPNLQDGYHTSKPYALFPDGRSLLICVELPDRPFWAWVHRLLRRSSRHWEFQRLPMDGSPRQHLFTVDQPVRAFSLAPDGTSLVYWLAVPEKEDARQAYWCRTVVP